ncbi:VCBS domain-containing protein [Vibrio sp. 10N.237.312.C02]|uniref:VCBS domain-containing protein n=1 Tax=unclassified Vibrio TaxID=2614977 RepID=UPI00352D073D
MANKKNVKANKKNTEIKSKKSNELEQKKPTQKKKRRLHSHLKVNIPLFQSLMMILPSLAKHAAAESIDNSSDAADQVIANNVTEKDVTDDHSKADSSAVALQEAQTSDNDVNSTLSASHAAHGSSSHLVPSHHLSTLSHPQVHYIPSVSMPTISSGSNGQPTHSNAPTTPALPVTFMPEVIKGTYGELHVDANGQYTFVLNPNSPQYILLNQHQPGTDHFALHLSNGSSIIVQIPVTGKQDTPSISGDLTGVVTEDHNIDSQGLLHANGKIDVIDPDQNESSVTPEVISGKYGSLTIDADGHWQYQVDNSLSNVQALTAATSLHESFTIHTKDGTPQTIDMTIGGNDDNAVITGVDAGTLTEDLTTQVQGLLSVTDSDLGEDHFQASQITSNFGTLSITKDGAWTYNLDNNNPAIQRLGQGSTATDIVTVHSADGTAHQVMVTINGTNDNAVITSSTANSPSSFFAIGTSNGSNQVTEDKDLTVSGQLNITDIDSKEAHFSNSDLKGTLGTLHLKDNGDWSYDLDNKNPKVQALGQGSATTDIITIHSADGTPHQIAITVNGTNDKAVISGTSAGVVTEESQLQTSGTLAVTDVDTGEAHFSNTDIVGSFGTLHLTDTGSWTYDLDNTNPTVQALGANKTATDTITVHSADGTPHQVTITVNGTNDTAVIGGTSAAAVTEETQLQTTGTLTITDTDGGEAHFANTDIQGTLGTLHLTDNGAWTYDLDNTNPAVQALGNGATATDTITVHSADGTPHQVTITVNGTNDNAVVGGVDTASVTEKAAGDNMSPDHAQPGMATLRVSTLNANGHLSAIDPDSGQSGFADNNVGYNYHGTYGDLILNPNGDWNYFADAGSLSHIGGRPTTRGSAIDKLGEGETLTDTITVHTKDGTPHNIVITINGSNDRPYCSSEVQLNAGTEDTRQTITAAQLLQNSIDVDKNDSGLLTVANLHPDHGSILDNQNGTYTFTPEKDYNGKVHFTYDVKDAHGGVTHTGATSSLSAVADKAVISGSDTGTIIEDHNVGHSSLQPVVASGLLSVTDPDAGQDHFQVNLLLGEQAIHDPFGGFLRITPSGAWGYEVANSRLQALAEGEVEKVVYRVYSADHTAHDITITVTGTNDQPSITATTLAHGTEDTHYQMQASQFGFSDIDTGDTLHSIAITDLPSATQGKFVLDGHDVTAGQHISTADISKLQFVPAQDFNGDVQFKFTVNDGHEDSLETTNTLHIDAVGDKAAISGVDTGDVHEGHTFTAPDGSMTGGYVDDRSPDHMHGNIGKLWNDEIHTDGHLSIVDADAGESYAQTGVYYGSHGRVILQTNGDWSYFASIGQDATGRAIDHLGKGESITDTVTVKSADGTTHDIVITIHGDNDRPYCSGEVQLNSGKEDLAQTISASELLANTLDVDTNDIGKLTITNLHADHGSILDNQDGTFTFTPTKDYNGQVHFTYDVKDAHGGVTHTGASTTLSAVGDAATIAGIDTGSISENTAGVDMSPDYAQPGIATLGNKPLYADGKLTITDPDVGEAEFEHQGSNGYDYHGTYGDLVLLTDGTWHYHADAGHRALICGTTTTRGTAIDQLGEGQSLTDTITIHSKDGTTHDIVITIHGSNDRPYCSSEVVLQSGSEDTRQTLTTIQLLANTVDVDKNDAGLLSIENLHADHGSILNNADGTFTFTPEKDYNGDVHFTYDVKDAHGGVTHTGASTTLAAVDDKTIISGVDHGVATEDVATVVYTNPHIMDAVDWQALQITDVDNPNTQVTVEFAGKQYTWNIGSDLDVTTPYGKFQFHTIASGSHKGEHSWSYIGDNNNVHVQELKHGESLTESIKLIATDGTEFPITVKVSGTEDGVVIDSKSELGHVVENAQTGASVSGNVVAHDVDLHDTVSWTQTPTGGISGQYGTFHLSADGQWHYDVDQSKATKLGDGDEYWEHFTVEAVSTDGSHVSKSVSVVVHGNNDVPTVSGEVTLPSGKEDTSIHITQAELIANATDVDANDRGWLHVENLTADHGSLVSNSDGSFTFNPDPNYNGAVHFTYDVADRHGGIAHTGANTTLAAVNDAAVFGGVDTGNVTEDHNAHVSVQGNYSYMLEARGTLTATDTDIGESGFDFKTLMTASAHPEWAPYQSKLGGQLEIDQHGKWNYYIDNRKPEVQGLGTGENLTDTVTIHSKDGTPHVITITINGTNDDPVLSVTQTTPTTGTLTESDVDVSDTHTFSVVSSTGQFGSLSVDPDSGAYVYTANGSVAGMSYNAATHTYHGTDVFEVKVSDNHGGKSSNFITFDTNGHVSVVPRQSPTISTSVRSNPLVTTTQPSLPTGTNTPPNNAVTVDLAASNDTGISDTDNLTKDSTPTITGHTDIPCSQVTIYDGSTPIGHAVSDGSGQYSVAVSSLSNGDHSLSAKALAPSSVLPATSSILSLHVDTVIAPLQVSLTHDSGSSTSDLISSDGSLTITGQEAGASVEYSTDGGHIWTSSFTPQSGSNTVSVRQTDTAGNVSTPTSLTFTYDDQIAAPSIDLKASTDSGVSANDDLTNIHTPIITGTAEANSSISITDETGKVIATGTANSQGIYQLTTSDIAEGKHTFTVSSTDAAGNKSTASLPVEVDYTAPTISKVNLLTETTHQPTFSGSVSTDTVSVDIVIKDGTNVIETLHATLDGKGGYTVDATNLPDGHYTAYIQATDKAGNTTASGYSGEYNHFSVDTQASAPTISFESTGVDSIYSAAEVAAGAANTITSTIHLPADINPRDTLTINGQPHVITDAEILAKVVNVEVAPGAQVTASITDQVGNTSSVINATAPRANNAPILNVQEQSFNDDNHQSIDMTLPANLFIDPEGDAITYSVEMVTTSGVSSLPNWLTFDPSTLKLTGTPPPEVSGDFDIRVTATDSHGANNHEDFHIAVRQLQGDVKEDGRAKNHQLDATGQLDAYHNGQHIIWHMKADGSDSLNHADGQYGHLSVSTGGTWHYVIDHDGDAHYANSDLNALRGGQVVPDSFTLYGYQNGQLVRTETIHIQVEGTNDNPTIRGISSLTTDENSIVSGKLDITDVDKGESFFNQQTITSAHGEFVIEKDGNWHFSPNQAAKSLTSTDSVIDTVEISSVDGTKHSLSVTVNGLDQPVLGVTDFSIQTNEDSPHTFTAAEFSTGNYDQLTISSLPDASHGTLTLNGQPVTAGQHIASGQIRQLVFSPAQNYHGDATFGFSVSENGLQSSVASAHVAVDSVTDAASIHIHTASDAVMQSAQGKGLAVSHLDGSHLSDGNGQTSITAEIVVRMKSGSNTNPDAVILQFGHAAAKGTMMNNPVALEEHTGDGSYYGTHHGFSVTNPQNLTLWMPGHMPIQTGIDTTTDSGTHRYTFTVDTASHSATVFEDGAQAFHTDSAHIWHWIADLKGTRVRLSGEFAGDDSVLKGEGFLLDSTPRGSLQHYPKFIAERMGDNGLNLGDGLHPLGNNKHEIMGSDGQMHAAGGDLSVDAKFSSAVIVQGSVTAGQVAAGPLNAQTPGLGDDKVLLDLGVQGGQIVDHTGHQSTALEHHSLNSPLIGGDPLHHELNLDVQATDPDDHVTSVKLTGLPDGTMLDDGHGHTATVHNGQAIDVQDWIRASIGVVLPNTAPTGDVRLHVDVTTTGPDGTTATSAADNTSMHVSDVMTDTAPDIIQSIMLGDEDQTYHFSEQDFGYSDKDGDPLDHVTITQLPDPAHGQLLINGHAVTAGQEIPVYDIGKLLFQPAKDFNGDVDFQYSVSDGLKDSAPSQGTLTIAPVVDVTIKLSSTSDSGSSNTDNLTNDATPTITGHTDIPYSQVTIYDGSKPIGHAVSNASGQYSVVVDSLTDGNHNLSAKALTPSSGLSTISSLLSVHIDTQVHVGIQTDPITADNVINAQESNSSIDITGSVSGDYNAGDIVTLDVNGTQHTGVVDAKGHYSIAVPGSELIADADQKIEASVAVTDSAGNSAHATADVTYQVDTQVSVPTITFENAGADNLYSKAEIARGQANTITATVTPPGDAKIGEHLVVNGQDHVLDAHTLQHGIQIEVHPGSNVQATMTDEHGNTAGSQGFAASAIPEPIIVRPPSGSHQVSGTLGVPPLLPSLTPVPTAQSGWRIHLPNGQYVTSHHGQYGTLTIAPQTGHLHYQEQAQVHTGPHGSASGIGQHEDKFEVALQGSNQDEVVAHVNIQILSHGPGNSGKLTVGTEVVDMTITPLVHTSHPAPPPPPPVQHDEPDMASQADFTVTLSDDSNLDLTQQTHQEPDQKSSHHGAAAYLDALGIKPDATSTTVHDQPADMDIVLAQVDQPDAATHDQAHLDMSDALEHHDANINHNQDDEHHHHNDIDGLPDIDPNS